MPYHRDYQFITSYEAWMLPWPARQGLLGSANPTGAISTISATNWHSGSGYTRLAFFFTGKRIFTYLSSWVGGCLVKRLIWLSGNIISDDSTMVCQKLDILKLDVSKTSRLAALACNRIAWWMIDMEIIVPRWIMVFLFFDNLWQLHAKIFCIVSIYRTPKKSCRLYSQDGVRKTVRKGTQFGGSR